MFDDHAPGTPVRCPVDGCGFAGTVEQVAAHVVDADDAAHDRLERRYDLGGADDAAGETEVEAFVRLLADAHDPAARYESDEQGGSLFPFDG